MGRGNNYRRAPFNNSYLMISFKKARLSAIQYEFTKDVFLLFNLIITDQRTNGRTDRQTDQQTDKTSYRVACPQLEIFYCYDTNEKRKKTFFSIRMKKSLK